eukprot:scaffold77497_cov69-Phaeocystis_antarctica.AAC.3
MVTRSSGGSTLVAALAALAPCIGWCDAAAGLVGLPSVGEKALSRAAAARASLPPRAGRRRAGTKLRSIGGSEDEERGGRLTASARSPPARRRRQRELDPRGAGAVSTFGVGRSAPWTRLESVRTGLERHATRAAQLAQLEEHAGSLAHLALVAPCRASSLLHLAHDQIRSRSGRRTAQRSCAIAVGARGGGSSAESSRPSHDRGVEARGRDRTDGAFGSARGPRRPLPVTDVAAGAAAPLALGPAQEAQRGEHGPGGFLEHEHAVRRELRPPHPRVRHAGADPTRARLL